VILFFLYYFVCKRNGPLKTEKGRKRFVLLLPYAYHNHPIDLFLDPPSRVFLLFFFSFLVLCGETRRKN
jgi:hypothetical protein